MPQILISLIVFLVGITFNPEITYGASGEICKLTRTERRLDKDQRDIKRIECFSKKVSQLSVANCEKASNSFEYVKNSDTAKFTCIFDAKHRPTAKECQRLANSIQSADLADEARWSCLKNYSKYLSRKDCNKLAKSMAYPTNSERAELFCQP